MAACQSSISACALRDDPGVCTCYDEHKDGRPGEVETPIGRFQFRQITSKLFYGFTEIEISTDQRVLLASAQKALIDLLYLTVHRDDVDCPRELWLEEPGDFNREDLHTVAASSGSSKVERAVDRLIEIWNKDVSRETSSD